MTSTILGYCRVSTKRQVLHGFSLQSQHNEISEYAFSEHREVRFFEDAGISGETISHRPALLSLIEVIKRDDSVKEVVVSRLDRLSRNTLDTMKLDEFFRLHDVRLVSLHEPLNSNNNAESKMKTNVFAVLAAFQRTIIQENARLSVAKRFNLGLPLSNNVPLGYVYKPELNRIYIDSNTAPLVQQCFEKYATGKWGYRKLVNWLSDQLGSPISLTTVRNMLKNEHYAGVSRTAYGVKQGVYPQIVNSVLYTEVQKQIAKHKSKQRCSHKNDMLYQRIICPICGHYLGVNLVRSHGREYRYYYCSFGVNSVKNSKNHHSYRVRADLVRETIQNSILKIIKQDSWKNQVIQNTKQLTMNQPKVANLPKRIPSKAQLYENFENGSISQDELKQGLQRITNADKAVRQTTSVPRKLQIVLRKLGKLSFSEFIRLIVKQVKLNQDKQVVSIQLIS